MTLSLGWSEMGCASGARHVDMKLVELQAPTATAKAAAAQSLLEEEKSPQSFDSIPEQYLILITCRDEPHQVELLTRFQTEGIDCKALLS